MENTATGWKPIPWPLKIVFVLLALWVLGSLMSVAGRYAQGLPFFGTWITGIAAVLVVLALDILGPLAFNFALWTRGSWGLVVAILFMGIFILNGTVALFTAREQLGLAPILIPNIVMLVFLLIVLWKREYLSNE